MWMGYPRYVVYASFFFINNVYMSDTCMFFGIWISVDKWMDITEMRYVIASRYNVILVSLSR